MAELKNPRDFPKALALLQTIDMTLYIIAAVVIYRYAGPDVSSPALGSASPLVSRIAYGIALPTVCNSTSAGDLLVHVLTLDITTRLSLLESSTAMLPPNRYTSESSLAQTVCISGTGWVLARGWALLLLFGLLLG